MLADRKKKIKIIVRNSGVRAVLRPQRSTNTTRLVYTRRDKTPRFFTYKITRYKQISFISNRKRFVPIFLFLSKIFSRRLYNNNNNNYKRNKFRIYELYLFSGLLATTKKKNVSRVNQHLLDRLHICCRGLCFIGGGCVWPRFCETRVSRVGGAAVETFLGCYYLSPLIYY